MVPIDVTADDFVGRREQATIGRELSVGSLGDELIAGLHHVQLAMPEGAEDQARDFYRGVLGLLEVDKPSHLQSRGGCWFRSSTVEVHLGVDPDFRPARKAHPAFIVDSLDQLAERLAEAGHEIDAGTQLSGFKRFHSADPFGNRLEFLERSAGS